MFNPEFRYLLVQEERNGQMMPLVDPHVLGAIFVCGINGIAISTICFLLYKFWGYVSIPFKKLLVLLWNSLTPGNELFEIAVIISSIICCALIFFVIQDMAEVLDSGFTKLRNELNKKDERIRELEEQVCLLREEKAKESKKRLQFE